MHGNLSESANVGEESLEDGQAVCAPIKSHDPIPQYSPAKGHLPSALDSPPAPGSPGASEVGAPSVSPTMHRPFLGGAEENPFGFIYLMVYFPLSHSPPISVLLNGLNPWFYLIFLFFLFILFIVSQNSPGSQWLPDRQKHRVLPTTCPGSRRAWDGPAQRTRVCRLAFPDFFFFCLY